MRESLKSKSCNSILYDLKRLVSDANYRSGDKNKKLVTAEDMVKELSIREEIRTMDWVLDDLRGCEFDPSSLTKGVDRLEDFVKILDPARRLHEFSEILLNSCKKKEALSRKDVDKANFYDAYKNFEALFFVMAAKEPKIMW